MAATENQTNRLETNSSEILDGYLTRKELARQLGKNTRSLDRWEMLRLGPPRVIIGRTVLYRVDSVRKWLESREISRGKTQHRGARP